MFRRIALALTAPLLLAGTLVAAGAPPASAADYGGGCRSANAGWASAPGGVLLNPCLYVDQHSFVTGQLQAENLNGLNVDYCAQLLRVLGDGSTKWEENFGCQSKWNSTRVVSYTAPGTTFNLWADKGNSTFPGPGVYVLQVGYWATVNGNYAYYGNAQSPRIYVDQPLP
ncbi:hypothetical protein [Streptomyces sp. SAS_260]|uniref:hypothetical protein n=1 Tax=Streptomyces sp. SAS_260 TaxID=3412751 RepID=UPI00403C774C